MSHLVKAYVGAQIHDGDVIHKDHALCASTAGMLTLLPIAALPEGCPTQVLNGGIITPGFVDLQVNGGGGVMFNDDQSINTLHQMAQAHQGSGTAALLPTLITDSPARTAAAIDAVEQAIAEQVPGIVGVHLEGPHLAAARKGAHDPALIRVMEEADLALMLNAAERLANVMVTVAPESTSLAQIKTMADAGITVSLGHSDADMVTCHAAFDAGASCVTHLFNAMSQLGNREPGLVGATLERADIYAGLIADGVHVHPAAMRIALAAKPHSNRVFLVTDAMAAAGSDITQFTLNGREIYRKDHRLTLSDGTLAGADLDMPRAISVMVDQAGDTNAAAITRATTTPTELLRESNGLGRIDGSSSMAVYFPEGLSNPATFECITG